MPHSRSAARVLVLIAVVSLTAVVSFVGLAPSQAEDAVLPVCPLALHEESLELEEAVLQVRLFRSAFAAFEEIYELVAGLWEAEAINRMAYLKAGYDRDAAKLDLERADLQLIRQEALIEQLRLACDDSSRGKSEDRARELERAYLRYRRADCDQQAKAIEVAETNLEFNRQWLASILDLRGQVSTVPDVIRAELKVKLEEQRRDDAIRRTTACRAELEPSAEPTASTE